MFWGILFSVIFGNSVSYARQEEKETVMWLQAHYPGYHFHYGKYEDRGIADRIRKRLWRDMPEYNHVIVKCNFKRIMETLKGDQKAICLTVLKKPEREKYLIYSDLTTVKPANGITILKRDKQTFGTNPVVSLAALLNNKQLRVGIMMGRSYGKCIDTELEKHHGENHIFPRAGEDGVTGLMRMLAAKRIDYIICYPHEAFIVADSLGIANEIVSYGVEGQPFLSYSYSACPGTDWGRQFIDKVNRIYKKEGIVQMSATALEKYLDANIAEHFRKQVRNLGLPQPAQNSSPQSVEE